MSDHDLHTRPPAAAGGGCAADREHYSGAGADVHAASAHGPLYLELCPETRRARPQTGYSSAETPHACIRTQVGTQGETVIRIDANLDDTLVHLEEGHGCVLALPALVLLVRFFFCVSHAQPTHDTRPISIWLFHGHAPKTHT